MKVFCKSCQVLQKLSNMFEGCRLIQRPSEGRYLKLQLIQSHCLMYQPYSRSQNHTTMLYKVSYNLIQSRCIILQSYTTSLYHLTILYKVAV
ncbi:hypothetical protein HanIR_Chr05g0218021 [Helianthus annuus]|nr:hypothetical protein HanIR_Chr05g0218021 [Helianthus annuus]